MSDAIHIISLGAGVQSSTEAVMAEHGEIKPKPIAAIMADTGDESEATKRWLEWLRNKLSFPIIIVKKPTPLSVAVLVLRRSRKSGNLYHQHTIPAYTLNADGRKGMLPRHCTRDYKIDLVNREAKRLMVLSGARKVILWMGISADEAHRMKPSRKPFIEHIWPLIDLGMTRTDCIQWMKNKGYPEPPPSACFQCPFRSDERWQQMKSNSPLEFARAVQFEKDYQLTISSQSSLTGIPFLHDSLKPLSEVDFEESQRLRKLQGEFAFGNECEGMCGV